MALPRGSVCRRYVVRISGTLFRNWRAPGTEPRRLAQDPGVAAVC